IQQLRTALSEDLRRELEQLVTSPAGLAAIASELAGAAGSAAGASSAAGDGASSASSAPSGTVSRHGADEVSASAPDALAAAASGSSSSLPSGLRARFESSLGTDLGGVRVHADAAAASAASAFGAHAFAHGQDVYFGAGQYQPGTPGGDHLIAHEVAHTVQQ